MFRLPEIMTADISTYRYIFCHVSPGPLLCSACGPGYETSQLGGSAAFLG